MVQRISWSAVAAVVFMVFAIGSAAIDENVFALTFALCSVTWAILSLKEEV